MGFILSKFRKKKTTTEQLESIEQQIRSIEKFHKETEQQFRRVVGKLLVSSILIYVVAVICYYYYYSPETFRDNIIKFLPLLVFPIMIIFSRRLLTWYYKRKLSKNESTLRTLKTDKKKILEEIMDKETYKVAKQILEKYAPDQLNNGGAKPNANSPLRAIMPATPVKLETTARHRMVTATPVDTFGHLSDQQHTKFKAVSRTSSALAQPRLSLPRPIIPRDRGAFDKLIDLIVGDGPGNRYALICKVCSSHNGMALKHEFEYLAFRCAYCLQWNPARKQKPCAPNLLSDSGSQDDSDENNLEADILVTDIVTKQNSDENNSGMKTFGNEFILDSEKNEDLHGTVRVEKEVGSIIEEANDSEFSKQSRPERSTVVGDDEYGSVSTEKIDLLDIHRTLEEIDNNVSSSSNSALLVTDFPIIREMRVKGDSTEYSN